MMRRNGGRELNGVGSLIQERELETKRPDGITANA